MERTTCAWTPFPIPTIEAPTDAIIRVTSTGICGCDLHLYEVLGPYMDSGDILGHEPMGIVEAVGAEVHEPRRRRPRRRCRSTSPAATASCATTGLQSQCETTQVREYGTGAVAARLHQALRPGPRRPGRVPARPAGPLRADQGPRGPAGRPLPVPLRRPPHRLAGRQVRRRARQRQRARARARADRRDVHARRPAPRRRDRHRHRPRARPPRSRATRTASPRSTSRTTTTSPATSANSPTAAAPTP